MRDDHPLTSTGALDLDGARHLADHLVTHGCDGLVLSGTTGGSPTTAEAEKSSLVEAVREAVGPGRRSRHRHRRPLHRGTGPARRRRPARTPSSPFRTSPRVRSAHRWGPPPGARSTGSGRCARTWPGRARNGARRGPAPTSPSRGLRPAHAPR
ncbi:dihydrodipicolinate synthase family protein [Streptomyces pimonensis]|uniref:dihydrodipicolinate synthase family protein n=1 Tax=Streptomyces pimonensis TaxID=2860288 RepID=UPI00352760DF